MPSAREKTRIRQRPTAPRMEPKLQRKFRMLDDRILLAYSEAGAEFTNEFGDIDERFYDSLGSAMDHLAEVFAELENHFASR